MQFPLWACSSSRRAPALQLRRLKPHLVSPNTCIEIVTLLKVYVFKQVTTDGSRGNRSTVHLDSGDTRHRAFRRRQPLPKIFTDTRIRVRRCHRKVRRDADYVLRGPSKPAVSGSTFCLVRLCDTSSALPVRAGADSMRNCTMSFENSRSRLQSRATRIFFSNRGNLLR